MSKFLTNLNLNMNELQNAILHPLATAPANPKSWQVYTNSADGVVYQYAKRTGQTGFSWQPVGVLYKQDSTAGAVITGLDEAGNVTTTNVVALTLTGYTEVEGGTVTAGMTLEQAIKALDTAVKAAQEGGEVNQFAFSNINTAKQSANDTTEVEGNTEAVEIAATAKTDTFAIASGDKWTQVKGDKASKTITVGHKFSGAAAGAYGDATHVSKITVDAAGHITAAESVEIVGAQYITGLTSDAQAQLDSKIPASEKGQANGVATLDAKGLIPSSQLPSYVDDVVDAYVVGDTALAADWLSKTAGGDALTPESDKIYVIVGPEGDAHLNQQYRWSGTTYVLCNPSDVNSVNGKKGVVVLTQDDIGAGETYTQYSKTEQTKLAGIDEGATKDTITLNGTATKTPTFFAPTEAGTADQMLVSGGAGTAPKWQDVPYIAKKYSATNSSLTAAGGAFTWSIPANTHGVSADGIIVQLFEAASGEMVIADVTVNPTSHDITIVINDTASAGTLAAGTYRAVVLG